MTCIERLREEGLKWRSAHEKPSIIKCSLEFYDRYIDECLVYIVHKPGEEKVAPIKHDYYTFAGVLIVHDPKLNGDELVFEEAKTK